jgi:hypothetical protein
MRKAKSPADRPYTSIANRVNELRREGIVSTPASDPKVALKKLAKRPGALRRFLDSRE